MAAYGLNRGGGRVIGCLWGYTRGYLNIFSTSRRVVTPPSRILRRRPSEHCAAGSLSSSFGVTVLSCRGGVMPRSRSPAGAVARSQ